MLYLAGVMKFLSRKIVGWSMSDTMTTTLVEDAFNAAVESFWGKLKTKMVNHEKFAAKAQARAAVFEYIEMFYNPKRLHAALNYLSPEEFEAVKLV